VISSPSPVVTTSRLRLLLRNEQCLNVQPLLTGPIRCCGKTSSALLWVVRLKRPDFWFANYEGQRRAESNKFSSVILNNLAAINAVKNFYGLAPETTNSLRTNDYNGFLLKLDHNLSEKNVLAARYNVLNSEVLGFLGGATRFAGFQHCPQQSHLRSVVRGQ